MNSKKCRKTPANWMVAGLVACMWLAGCGGGGGGGGKPPAAEQAQAADDIQLDLAPQATATDGAGHVLQFAPGRVTLRMHEGLVTSFRVTATVPASTGYAAPYVDVVDPDRIFLREADVEDLGGGSYAVTMWVNAFNTAPSRGRHVGNIELRFCTDSSCATHLPGSPWKLPYDVTVNPFPGTLTPLSIQAGIPDWTTYKGNAAHTGYVPLALDAARFSKRWLWGGLVRPRGAGQAFSYTWPINPVVAAGGRVYFSTNSVFLEDKLFALDEHDGHEIWSRVVSEDVDKPSPVAIGEGRLWLTDGKSGAPALRSYSPADGSPLSVVPLANFYTGHFYAPVPHADGVYVPGGYPGGVASYAAGDGSSNWYAMQSSKNEWTPAVDDDYVYAFHGPCGNCGNTYGAVLDLHNRADGTRAFVIPDPDGGTSEYDLEGAPVLAGPGSVLVSIGRQGSGRLMRFDTASRSLSWSLTGRFPSNPAYAHGLVYTAQSRPFRVEARDLATGALRWTWNEPAQLRNGFRANDPQEVKPGGDIVVTDSHLFVSSQSRVYALDLRTQQSVWNYPRPGKLAISNRGVLYIATGWWDGDGQLVAINLR